MICFVSIFVLLVKAKTPGLSKIQYITPFKEWFPLPAHLKPGAVAFAATDRGDV